jgi:hypothetical protein
MKALPMSLRRRHLAQPPRIEALNRKRRIMRDPRAARPDCTRLELLMLVVCALGIAGLLVSGMLRAGTPEPCTAKLTRHGHTVALPGVWLGGQCVIEVRP